jgi:hypothetical protein
LGAKQKKKTYATTTNDKLLLLLLLQQPNVAVQHIANITIIQHNASSDFAGYFVSWFNGQEFSARNNRADIVSLGLIRTTKRKINIEKKMVPLFFIFFFLFTKQSDGEVAEA